MSEVMACPFCGGKASEDVPFQEHRPVCIGCPRCDVWMRDQSYSQAASDWNTRATPPADAAAQEQIARLPPVRSWIGPATHKWLADCLEDYSEIRPGGDRDKFVMAEAARFIRALLHPTQGGK